MTGTRWFFVLSLLACAGHATSSAPRRAAYVRDVAALAANAPARARIERLVAAHRVTDLVAYGMGPMLVTRAARDQLAAWIDEIHRAGGRVVAPIAGVDRLDPLARFLDEHPRTWLDGLVTEVEYWNRADRHAGFVDLLALLGDLRAQAHAWARHGHAVSVGAYLGYPTADEARRIARAVDAVYLDYTVTDPALAWRHVRGAHDSLPRRFGWFARRGVAVWPIFYAEGDVNMGAALARGGVDAAEATFRADLLADPLLGTYDVAGFAYFTVEAL